MYRVTSTVRKPSNTKPNQVIPRNGQKNIKQQSDSTYLIQNQNQILRLKNSQLSNKLTVLSSQLQQRTNRISQQQKNCQVLKQQINLTFFTKDIQLSAVKNQLIDRILIGKGNLQIYQEKIKDARMAVVMEEQKIHTHQQDKIKLNEQIRIVKMQNQGEKTVLKALDQQNQQLRQINAQQSLKKYAYGPQQQTISKQIQQRIRLIKNINSTQKLFKRQQTSKLFHIILASIQQKTKKQSILLIERFGLKRSILKKKVYLLSYIRKSYLNTIKTKVLSIFRQSFKPLQQEQKLVRILSQMKKRREKAKIWRIWRNETAKAQYKLIRKYECQNSIQKVCKSYLTIQLSIAFTKIKYHANNHKLQKACHNIYSILSRLLTHSKNELLSKLKGQKQKLQIHCEIQKSAQQHSRILGLGRYFKEWATLVKTNKTVNLYRQFKCFDKLKYANLKKKDKLNQMLCSVKQKVSKMNLLSACFTQLKRECIQSKNSRLVASQQQLTSRLNQTQQDTLGQRKFNQISNKNLALLKLSSYLKKRMQQNFSIWRNQNKRLLHLKRILSIIEYKSTCTINYAFSRLQRHRFQSLKVSIRKKITDCQGSYDYLTLENTHIKSVLSKKSHQLEKTKFVKLLKRLIRQEKHVKHLYFYKFLKNGFNCWNFKKFVQRIDNLMTKKIKMVFLFLLNINRKEVVRQAKIQYFTNRHDELSQKQLITKGFNIFKNQTQRNKRFKRVLSGIFDRNLQLNFYQAFGLLRNQSYISQLSQLSTNQQTLHTSIQQTCIQIESTSQKIQMLTVRLKQKQQTFKQRKTTSIYIFFLKNIQQNVGSYIRRWKMKVQQEKRVKNFVNLLENKTKSILKIKFLLALHKTKNQLQSNQLTLRLDKFKNQYQMASNQYDKFISESQDKSQQMKIQNTQNDLIIQEYEKKTQHMNNIKVNSFLIKWGKTMQNFIFKQWKERRIEFKTKWTKIYSFIQLHQLSYSFQLISNQIRNQMQQQRIRSNIIKITNKTYQHNTGLTFRIWRFVNIMAKKNQHQQELQTNMNGMRNIQHSYQNIQKKYIGEVDFRIRQFYQRKVWNALRIYNKNKQFNQLKQTKLRNWLSIGYSVDVIDVLRRNKASSFKKKQFILDFRQKFPKKQAKIFLTYLYTVCRRKHTINSLFIKKFSYYQTFKLNQEFLYRLKNYSRYRQVQKKDTLCHKLQKLISLVQRKRLDILCENMCKWRRNQYLIKKQKNLFKRLTRNAMNFRIRDIFFAWNTQSQARTMLKHQKQQGEIFKRQKQIKRLMVFLNDFKKDKGLLLQNQEGNYVVSPRFQQNKEKQLKRQNNLKYRFISRLILSTNGYQAPIKVWNNFKIFTQLRTKYKKLTQMTLNRAFKKDFYEAWNIWRLGTQQQKKMFQNMQRKDLIRILNRQKDKMQIQYSKKLQVQQKVQTQLKRHKILSYQQKRKQRICAQILFKQARKVKSYAFQKWRTKVTQIKDDQANELQQRGNNKVMNMQDQLRYLEEQQKKLEEQNYIFKQAVQQALQLAEMIKRISQERDNLRRQLSEGDISCQNLQQQNQQLNNKLILAQRQAMNLLTLSQKGIR